MAGEACDEEVEACEVVDDATDVGCEIDADACDEAEALEAPWEL